MSKLYGEVKKAWGSELIVISTDKYCGKFLRFNTGGSFSTHFHAVKDESWYCMSGKFELHIINTKNASTEYSIMVPGSVRHIEPLVPHKLVCLEEGTILEVSTPDSVEDNYRVLPGDSQKQNG